MPANEHGKSSGWSIALTVLRCFNAAAFVALSAFYFGMFCLDKPAQGPMELTPLVQNAPPTK